MRIEAECKVGAVYKLEAYNPSTGEIRQLTGLSENLVTDAGLDLFKNTLAATATSNNYVYNRCAVSSDNTPPLATHTSLDQVVASTNQALTISGSYGAGYQVATETDKHYWWLRTTYVWPEGLAQGNLSKIGLLNRNGSIDTLVSAALLRDVGGNPTTITVQPNEELRALVEFRIYPGDVTVREANFNVVDGANVVKSSHTARMVPRKVALSMSDDSYNRWMFGLCSYSQRRVDFYQNGTITDYNTVTASGQSTSKTSSQVTNDINDGNPRQSTMLTTVTTTEMNTGGIGAILLQGGISAWNIAINPPIPKASDYQLRFSFTEKVTRYTG